MTLRFNKQQLLEALEALRPAFTAIDKKALADHKAAEKVALQEFRQHAREYAKYTYKEYKKHGLSPRDGSYHKSSPSCPLSLVARLDLAIHSVTLSMASKYVINSFGIHSNLHKVLTLTAPKDVDMCWVTK